MPKKSFEENIIDENDTATMPQKKVKKIRVPNERKIAIRALRVIRKEIAKAMKAYRGKEGITKNEFKEKLVAIIESLNQLTI